jgi:hypothetical protein
MIAEEARFTDREIGLEEHALEVLNRKLQRIAELVAAGQSPALTFTVFVPDASKDGGSYTEVTDRVKRIDEAAGEVVLMSKRKRSGVRESIPLARIVEIRGEAVDGISEGDVVEADLDNGVIYNRTTGQSFNTQPFPAFIQQIITNGGLVESIKNGSIK